jgi:DNA-binding MarR family transcriptional regulator
MIVNPFPVPDGRTSSTADEVWSLLAELAIRYLQTQYAATFAQLGLTPPEARALYFLQPGVFMSQRELATAMGCSPSYITALADRLQEAGIVERHVDSRDRRVNTLALTQQGRTLQAKLAARLYDAPEAIAELDPDQLESLRDLLLRLLNQPAGSGSV